MSILGNQPGLKQLSAQAPWKILDKAQGDQDMGRRKTNSIGPSIRAPEQQPVRWGRCWEPLPLPPENDQHRFIHPCPYLPRCLYICVLPSCTHALHCPVIRLCNEGGSFPTQEKMTTGLFFKNPFSVPKANCSSFKNTHPLGGPFKFLQFKTYPLDFVINLSSDYFSVLFIFNFKFHFLIWKLSPFIKCNKLWNWWQWKCFLHPFQN